MTEILNYLRIVKNNISLIILIPTIIGGVNQVYQLAIISPILIRFFSITQLISDGLFLIGLLILSFIFPFFVAKILNFTLMKYFQRKNFVITFSILLLGIIISEFVLYKFDKNYFQNNVEIHFLLFSFLIFCFILGVLLLRNIQMKNNRSKIVIFSTLATLIVVAFFASFMFSGKIFTNLNKKIPIDNFEVLQKKYKKEGKVNILYFNDKYIFIETSFSSMRSKIHIEKTDVLFQ